VGLFYFENVYGLRSRIFIINHVNLEVNHHMQITGIAVTVVFAIILFEVFPEKSIWSIPAKQVEEHMIAVPGSGGFSLLLMQKQEAYKTATKGQERFWERILIVDDDADITTTFRKVIEDSNNRNSVVVLTQIGDIFKYPHR
jgi:hypothetical protein